MNGKTVVIGLDGFHIDMVEQFELNNIQSIWDNSLSGLMKSTIPMYTCPAWATLQTGQNLGNLGISYFLDQQGDIILSNHIHYPTFYEAMVEQGIKVFILNIPLTYPPKINGDLITGWDTPSDNIRDYIHPPSLMTELPILKKYIPHMNGIKGALKAIQRKSELIPQVMKNDKYDFLFFYISETDWIQHHTLHLIDTDKKKLEVTTSLFKMVDEIVGEVEGYLNEKDRLILMSDHGFKTYTKTFYINNWLHERGFLHLGGEGRIDNSNFFGWKNFNFAQKLIKHFPFIHRPAQRVKELVQSHLGIDLTSKPPINITKSHAYCRTDQEQGIRINPDVRDYSSFKTNLIQELNMIEGLIALDRDELYHGEKMHLLPDIFLVSEKYRININTFGFNFKEFIHSSHHQDGIFSVRGQKIPSGILKDMKAINFAPTLLYIMNLSIPKIMEGKVCKDFLNLYGKEPKYYNSKVVGESSVLARDEQKIVKERLKDLGYL